MTVYVSGGVHLPRHAISALTKRWCSIGTLLVVMYKKLHMPHTHPTSDWIIITGLSKVSTSSSFLPSSCNNNGLCQNFKSELSLAFLPSEPRLFLAHAFYSPSTYSQIHFILTFSPYSTVQLCSKRWPFQWSVCEIHQTHYSAQVTILMLIFVCRGHIPITQMYVGCSGRTTMTWGQRAVTFYSINQRRCDLL